MHIDPLTDRDAWLVARRKGIGASDAPAALGLSPFVSPRALYLEKLGLLVQPEDERMRWGNLLEPVILQEYCERTGETIARRQVMEWADPAMLGDLPLFATLDARCESGRLVEVKTTSERYGQRLVEGAPLPEHIEVQAQQQMLIANVMDMDVVFLIGGQRMVILRVDFRGEVVRAMLEGLRRFWRCVIDRTPPPLKTGDDELMHLIYPDAAGEISLTADDSKLVDAYVGIKSALKEGEKLNKAMRETILERMGNARVALLPDGRSVTRSVRHVKGGTTVRKPSTYSVLYISEGRDLSIEGGDDDE